MSPHDTAPNLRRRVHGDASRDDTQGHSLPDFCPSHWRHYRLGPETPQPHFSQTDNSNQRWSEAISEIRFRLRSGPVFLGDHGLNAGEEVQGGGGHRERADMGEL